MQRSVIFVTLLLCISMANEAWPRVCCRAEKRNKVPADVATHDACCVDRDLHMRYSSALSNSERRLRGFSSGR